MAVNFPSLPEECWELIFTFLLHRRHGHYLESLSLVCKQFLSITNKLRTRLRISDLTVLVIPQIFSRFKQLKHIDLQNFTGDLDSMLFQIAESGLDIESLNISKQLRIPVLGLKALGRRMQNLRTLRCSKMGVLRNSDVLVIAGSFPNLKELDISYPINNFPQGSPDVDNFSEEVTDSGILALTRALPGLHKVNLSGNSFITNKALLKLSMKCVWLNEIVVSDCDLITHLGVAKALLHCSNLKSISASVVVNWNLYYHQTFIESLVSVKTLTTLDLSDSHISDDFLFSVGKSSLPLKKLVLSNCIGFSSSGILSLLSNNRLIEWLDLEAAGFLTDHHVTELSNFIKGLKFINISSCSYLTGACLFLLARHCPILTGIEMKCVSIEDRDKYYYIGTHFNPHVTSLNLSMNDNLCDEFISKFASLFPNLEVLKLNKCSRITEKGVAQVLNLCRKMKQLDLKFCYGIKNIVLEFELASMEALRLQGLRIEDEALTVIGKKLPSLIHLDLRGCLLISSKGVKEMVRNCRGLREINLWGCELVDYNVIPWIVFSSTHLRELIPPNPLMITESEKSLYLRHGCVVFNDDVIHELDLKDIA